MTPEESRQVSQRMTEAMKERERQRGTKRATADADAKGRLAWRRDAGGAAAARRTDRHSRRDAGRHLPGGRRDAGDAEPLRLRAHSRFAPRASRRAPLTRLPA